MPELPEVETTRRCLAARLLGRSVSEVVVRNPRLRQQVSSELATELGGETLGAIDRRGKYLLLRFGRGTVLAHLGMSGNLRVLSADVPARTHDHVDIVFGEVTIRYSDPRRFGLMLWLGNADPAHPLLASLGVEPLEPAFSADWLHRATRGRRGAIKQLLMDSHFVAGIGNIYASESLFRAGIRPRTAAQRLTRAQCARLVVAIRQTLTDAISAGGTTLRDFLSADGTAGHFRQQHYVYDRADEACRVCGTPIRGLRLGQRATYYCPTCQK